jgi:polar amino acid transport system substrate-binding protein
MKSRLAFWIALVAALSITTAVFAACNGSGAVTLATAGDYHPFNFIDDAGEIDGLEREMGDELCRRAHLDCEWMVNEWDTLIPNLVAEDFDVIIAGMSITAERDETIDFTQPYYPPTPSVYLALAGAGDEAAQGRLGAHDNTIYSDYFTASGIPFEVFPSGEDQVDALFDGTVDAILVDQAFAAGKLMEFAGQLAIVGPSVELDMGIGMGVREDSELKAKLDEALSSMKADGSLNEIILKWVGEDAVTF